MKIINSKEQLYKELLIHNYYELKPNQKKVLVNDLLKKYLINYIDSFTNCGYISSDYSVNDLIKYLSNNSTITPIILFIISIMNDIQNKKITWVIDPNRLCTEIIIDNKYISKIISNDKYSEVFDSIYNYYLNEFDKEEIKTLKK